MQFIVLMRGIKASVDRCVDDISKILLPMWMALPAVPALLNVNEPMPQLSGAQTAMNMVQVAVRPIQLYEVVFPKEHEELMTATLFDKARGQTHSKWLIKWFNLLRRLLHLEPIDWDYREKPAIPINKDFVEIIGIGKKSDRIIKDEKTGMEYEGL